MPTLTAQPGAKRLPSEKQPDTSTYSGRVAARIRALRKACDMDREQFRAALAKLGVDVALSTLYGWENGNTSPDPDRYPAIAKALRCKSVRDFLPER
jgi:transcriptional regulator with XRE-family HTH domain